MKQYDVFISSKSEDYEYAREIYTFLVNNGISVFFADEELKNNGSSEYSESIDQAIDASTHMMVFASKIDYINSTWVKSEWRAFTNEIRSGRKRGNIITILKDIQANSLPLVLRNYQSISYSNYQESILNYIVNNNDVNSTLPNRRPIKVYAKIKKHAALVVSSIVAIGVFVTLLYTNIIISESEAKQHYISQQESAQKELKMSQISVINQEIRYIGGRMDSAYSVARRCSRTLAETHFEELVEMEEGTLEYKDEAKKDFMVALYPLEIDPSLIDYIECAKIYNDGFEAIDSLLLLKDQVSSKNTVIQYNDNNLAMIKLEMIFSKFSTAFIFLLIVLLSFCISLFTIKKISSR